MSTLYSSAELVIGWLGATEPERMAQAFETVDILGKGFSKWNALRWTDRMPDSMTCRDLEWLADHPQIYQPDSVDSSAADERWTALRGLLDSPYWTRIWIFQEVVLARRLILACPSACVDYSLLLDAVTGMRDVALAPLSSSWDPSLIAKVVQPIRSVAQSNNREIIEGIYIARALCPNPLVPLPPGQATLLVQLMAHFVCGLQATNPKDYVYSILSLNRLQVVPNYSDAVPFYIAWVDYVKAWISLSAASLDAPVTVSTQGFWASAQSKQTGLPRGMMNYAAHCELGFLHMAGIGLFDYPTGCPSWVPHFSAMAENPTLGLERTCWAMTDPADRGLRLDRDDVNEIIGSKLRTRGLLVQRIAHVVPLPRKVKGTAFSTPETEHIHMACMACLLPFMSNFVSRQPQHVMGIAPLHALTRILLYDFASPISTNLFFRACKLIFQNILLLGYRHHEATDPCPLSLAQFFIRELSIPSLDGFKHWLIDNFWTPPEIFTANTSKTSLWQLVSSWINDLALESTGLVIEGTLSSLGLMTPFETQDGYLGMCPRGSQPGDLVCVLYGNIIPVVLRRVDEEHYLNVGRCTLLGFMNGETCSSVSCEEESNATPDLQTFCII